MSPLPFVLRGISKDSKYTLCHRKLRKSKWTKCGGAVNGRNVVLNEHSGVTNERCGVLNARCVVVNVHREIVSQRCGL